MAGPVSIFNQKKIQPVLAMASVQDVVNLGDCALESANTYQVRSEIIQDASEEKCV